MTSRPAPDAGPDAGPDANLSSVPTGQQWTVSRDDDELTVVQVGGGLRTWTRGGVDVVAGYPADATIVAGRGQQLIPWPNRIADGRWSFDGADHQLALTEPKLHNASHGLVRWAPWSLGDLGEHHVTLTHRLHPQPGWDWVLDLATTYTLTGDGLEVTTRATNLSAGRAPYGYGAHPYLHVGAVALDELTLTLPGSTFLEVSPDRLLPVATHDVDGTTYDFRGGRVLGPTDLDTAFTDLARGPDGRWEARLDGVALGTVTLWADEHYNWMQVFTGRATSQTEGSNGVAIEPMTCPPAAFSSGTDLVVLAPGASHTGTWGIRVG
ncbi:MAG: aldose 1-epimerase family protein [Actinomycetota bacterium]|nr:aldose 1-epimerase family protein [Actinomycetota bacterium]